MADFVVIAQLDAKNEKIILEVRNASTNARVSTDGSRDTGSLEILVDDLLGKRITARETKSCDDAGNPVYCVMLRSAFYDTPVGSDFS